MASFMQWSYLCTMCCTTHADQVRTSMRWIQRVNSSSHNRTRTSQARFCHHLLAGSNHVWANDAVMLKVKLKQLHPLPISIDGVKYAYLYADRLEKQCQHWWSKHIDHDHWILSNTNGHDMHQSAQLKQDHTRVRCLEVYRQVQIRCLLRWPAQIFV